MGTDIVSFIDYNIKEPISKFVPVQFNEIRLHRESALFNLLTIKFPPRGLPAELPPIFKDKFDESDNHGTSWLNAEELAAIIKTHAEDFPDSANLIILDAAHTAMQEMDKTQNSANNSRFIFWLWS